MIRQATPQDIPAIIDLLYTLHSESPVYSEEPVDEFYVEANLLQMLESEGAVVLIDDEYRGFMIGAFAPNWFSRTVQAYEVILCIAPEHRGGILAARLIKEFERYAKSKGAVTVSAGASTGMSDERTINLYIRLGYVAKTPTVTKRL
ncbi:GNAT family N-acetyltransferase [Pannonibacter sp. SL95]|uniref:GNAT family N-acetyltransferase n=1 Tax=Pannonibacter sp. SL95 TaxID=2995153 RepID=UPI002276BAF1|nr:GNAT family N-acetyltransferase [Pannonibacter sp. SL95]MCY1708365.1 GNAT family N-acetyltransferase [Pannonibacter sp. SL95]